MDTTKFSSRQERQRKLAIVLIVLGASKLMIDLAGSSGPLGLIGGSSFLVIGVMSYISGSKQLKMYAGHFVTIQEGLLSMRTGDGDLPPTPLAEIRSADVKLKHIAVQLHDGRVFTIPMDPYVDIADRKRLKDAFTA